MLLGGVSESADPIWVAYHLMALCTGAADRASSRVGTISRHRSMLGTATEEIDEARIEGRYADGSWVLVLIAPDHLPPLSTVDCWKEYFEHITGAQIDWWPFKQGNRSCPGGHTRVFWKVNSPSVRITVALR